MTPNEEHKLIAVLFNIFCGFAGVAAVYAVVKIVKVFKKQTGDIKETQFPNFGRGFIGIGWLLVILVGLCIYYLFHGQ